ncbi:hypothetical protein CABS01_14941 [Colletotrichum abscissum]|nr:uncharacterized protein CABS01_14941 [Colletotrichum abscissum]KAK1477474.1 hypothetical protein CABS01_14941 [Colletotrichum abscissum]
MALFSPPTCQIWMNYLSVGAFFMRRNDFLSVVVFISFFLWQINTYTSLI